MYGSVAGIEALASTWTSGGVFLDPDVHQAGTNPPLSTVEAWLESMSAYMDAALKDNYFQTPITDDFAVSFATVNEQVNMLVAALVEARNRHGANFPLQPGETTGDKINWKNIQKNLIEWVKNNVETFLAESVPQITTNPIRAGQQAVILLDDEWTANE